MVLSNQTDALVDRSAQSWQDCGLEESHRSLPCIDTSGRRGLEAKYSSCSDIICLDGPSEAATPKFLEISDTQACASSWCGGFETGRFRARPLRHRDILGHGRKASIGPSPSFKGLKVYCNPLLNVCSHPGASRSLGKSIRWGFSFHYRYTLGTLDTSRPTLAQLSLLISNASAMSSGGITACSGRCLEGLQVACCSNDTTDVGVAVAMSNCGKVSLESSSKEALWTLSVVDWSSRMLHRNPIASVPSRMTH